MTDPRYTIETEPDPHDIQFIEDRIIEYNYNVTGIRDGELLAIFVKDDQGSIQAGLSGFTWGGTCRIEWLWVQEDLRGLGTGRDLLAAAEQEARRRGCHQIVLDTHSFQAPGFYLKQGFEIAGQFEQFPRGHQSIFLVKKLSK